jgi:hypothetical protein
MLVLTAFFVMLSKMLIYTPFDLAFRPIYLEKLLASAHLATLAIRGAPDRIDRARRASF